MTKLKPCPFCGSEVNITYQSTAGAFAVWHKKQCSLIEPFWIDGEYADSLSKAGEIWNNRIEVVYDT